MPVQQKIRDFLRAAPEAVTSEIAGAVGLTHRQVRRRVLELRAEDFVE